MRCTVLVVADASLPLAEELMTAFEGRGARYLWTDAFAVCNRVGLARAQRDDRWLARADALVDRVHASLGRWRDDDPRRGWLSGDESRPTRRGLRIGKKLPERAADERMDPRLEWDRDGQYFHYLTRWMHALDVLARERRDRRLQRFAYDLAIVAHDAFTRDARMYWKMSTDLSRPLVTSMGQHDPLDGIVTYAQLRETANAIGVAAESEQLGARIVSFARTLLARVLDAAEEGLEAYALSGELDAPADHRLAFRELGLAIGLSAMPRMPRERARFERFAPIRERIVSFWRAAENRSSASYVEHRDIDDVMLVTSLVPDGALTLRPLPIARQAAHAQQ